MSAKARKTRKGEASGAHRRQHRGLKSEATQRARAKKYAPKTIDSSPQRAREHRAKKLRGDDSE